MNPALHDYFATALHECRNKFARRKSGPLGWLGLKSQWKFDANDKFRSASAHTGGMDLPSIATASTRADE